MLQQSGVIQLKIKPLFYKFEQRLLWIVENGYLKLLVSCRGISSCCVALTICQEVTFCQKICAYVKNVLGLCVDSCEVVMIWVVLEEFYLKLCWNYIFQKGGKNKTKQKKAKQRKFTSKGNRLVKWLMWKDQYFWSKHGKGLRESGEIPVRDWRG